MLISNRLSLTRLFIVISVLFFFLFSGSLLFFEKMILWKKVF